MPGLSKEQIQPVGIRFSADSKLAFVATGPANRVAVIDAATKQVLKNLLVGQRVWQLELTPDGKYLVTTNGVSNDVSVIDVATGIAHNVTTDAAGTYSAANLRPGEYQVRVTATGFNVDCAGAD